MHAYSEKKEKKKYFRLIILCCTWTFCPQHQKFDAVVGDVEIVSSRYEYAEFTNPYTETGLVLIVPARSSSKAWSFENENQSRSTT